MAALERLGGDTWFRLGDADLALHVERTRRLAAGANLTDVTDALRHRLDIGARILPMSDDPVRTRLRTDAGWLDFQDYFVRHRCEPVIREIAFEGARVAAASPAVLEALRDPALRAVVVCPSNPLLSVAPMLAIPALRAALCDSPASVVAVSPVIAGEAVKGPTAKLLRELGHESSAAAVARAYVDFVDVFVVDERDAATSVPPGMRLVTAQTLMASIEDRERLARAVLAAADAH
jgi:LPPG:FO 2-phospho-L-lactate transferase